MKDAEQSENKFTDQGEKIIAYLTMLCKCVM